MAGAPSAPATVASWRPCARTSRPAPPAADAVGPAHVGVVSFLAARAAPTGGFGSRSRAAWRSRRSQSSAEPGSASARAPPRCSRPSRSSARDDSACRSPRRSPRMLRGHLHARGVGLLAPAGEPAQLVRLLHNAATTAFFIWVITDELGSARGRLRRNGPPGGHRGGDGGRGGADRRVRLLAWAAFASTVQVLVYGRGLRAWRSNDGNEEPEHRWWGIGAGKRDDSPPPREIRPQIRRPQCCRCIRVTARKHGVGLPCGRRGVARRGLGAVAGRPRAAPRRARLRGDPRRRRLPLRARRRARPG